MRARVLHRGRPAWGSLEADTITLDDGTRIAEAEAQYLAPAEPSKILAVHHGFSSRVEEYAARIPSQPSYFMKAPGSLNGHRGVVRRLGRTRFLNYEGELAVLIGQQFDGP